MLGAERLLYTRLDGEQIIVAPKKSRASSRHRLDPAHHPRPNACTGLTSHRETLVSPLVTSQVWPTRAGSPTAAPASCTREHPGRIPAWQQLRLPCSNAM